MEFSTSLETTGMADKGPTTGVQSEADWRFTPEEMGALRSTRRWFLAGWMAAGGLAVGLGAAALWGLARHPGVSLALAAGLVFLATLAAAVWCVSRARILGLDIEGGRAETQWGRVTRMWRHLRVVEVEGTSFPLQMTPVPALREGERVRLRFAPRSRITLRIETLREVITAERLAGRPVCAGAVAELGEPH
jgi:hypothetical protein